MSPTLTFKAGGTLGQNDFYIEREADAQLLAHCLHGDFAYVLTTRQVGKSSLMERTAYRLAEEHHVRTAIIDLNKIGTTGITSASWYYSIMQVIEEALNLTTKVEDWWPENPQLTDVARFQRFLEQVVLAEVTDPIVIFIDEIEGTLKLDFADDFFAAVRSLYNARAHTPALERLTFVLIGSATPNEFIQDPERTPFNIGHQVELDDFRDEDEAAAFTAGFDAPEEQARQILGWVLAWTRGHPYLTQKVCAELVKGEKLPTSKREVKVVIQNLFLAPESDDSNIQFVGRELPKPSNPQDRDAVLSTYLEIWAGVPVPDDAKSPIHAHLKLAGSVRRERRFLRVRNPIYRRVFDWRWVGKRLSLMNWWRDSPPIVKRVIWFLGVLFVFSLSTTTTVIYQINLIQQQNLEFAQADPDGDGLNNQTELAFGTNPRDSDSNDNGINDFDEVSSLVLLQLPDGDQLVNQPEMSADADHDELPDSWETQYNLDPFNSSATDGAEGDPDDDGLNNQSERAIGTNPLRADTDGDGLPDAWEVVNGLNPLNAIGVDGAQGDPDQDGLTNWEELAFGTKPKNSDTDSDTFADADEVHIFGTDPTNPDTDYDGSLDGIDVNPTAPSTPTPESES